MRRAFLKKEKLTDPEKLRLLAKWIDLHNKRGKQTIVDVPEELIRIATKLAAFERDERWD